FGNTAAVITSDDVWSGLTTAMNLTSGAQYRVYAVYSNKGMKEEYAKNVVIKEEGTLKNYTVAELATPKNSDYILDDSNFLTAPITITDNNLAPGSQFAEKTPFTIYIVSSFFPAYPVVSAQYAKGQVQCNSVNPNSLACTVLSAEKNFQLENVDVGSHLSILTKQLRCESIETTTDLRDFSDQTVGSSVLISGPIATLWNGIDQPYTFHFVITR
ncbi:hypothetical protein PFISCL1PPCAC_6984, partial [Pristionchus fissidentatus]